MTRHLLTLLQHQSLHFAWIVHQLLLFSGGSPSKKPIHSCFITRQNTRSKAFSKEVHEIWLKAMVVRQLYVTPDHVSPCKRCLLEAQPLRHHRVYSITPNQYLFNCKNHRLETVCTHFTSCF
ncbi:hypothetical protein V8G54_028343 [Vigna mungo]|uniref:Uncharacterized protein n=1 Tax=Vigna mungo TaxID=3915 RepID=A0AAQ3RKG4_VIGMU